MGLNYIIVIADLYRLYTQHFIVGNSLYKLFLSLILQGIPNRLPKIVFAISSEHALQDGNIRSRIILDVDMLILMDKAYILIIAMNRASFG